MAPGRSRAQPSSCSLAKRSSRSTTTTCSNRLVGLVSQRCTDGCTVRRLSPPLLTGAYPDQGGGCLHQRDARARARPSSRDAQCPQSLLTSDDPTASQSSGGLELTSSTERQTHGPRACATMTALDPP